jgi:Tol biopolymer transport system component/DNA-binding winged helix-turn-helix (wHTH) protein
MATSRSSPLSARFGQFELDMSTRELLRAGSRVPVQDKPLQILRLLLEAEGQVVTREQVRSVLWPEDTFVDFEHGVNTAVKKLRQALEDSAENPQYVETLPRLGYRFMIPVEWVAGENGPKTPQNVVVMASPEPAGTPHLTGSMVQTRNRWRWHAVAALMGFAIGACTITLAYELGEKHRTQLMALLHRIGAGNRAATQASFSRRLTANPGDTPLTSGAISPDGKYLAYTDSTGFYLRLVDSSETHRVPLPDGFDPAVECWFPDSIHLVVSWIKYPGTHPPSLWVISIMGGTPRKIADEGSWARVSPDGTEVAFEKGPWDDEEIWLVDANGNGIRRIVDGGTELMGTVAWAPDGRKIAYARSSTEQLISKIETYDLTTGRFETILSTTLLGREIVWTATGRLIYSLHEEQPNQSDANLWGVQIDPRTGRAVSTPARITNDREGIQAISVTSDGKRLASLRVSSQADVYLSDLEDQGKRLSAPRRLTLNERQDFPASWTPDSRAVLVVSDRDGPSHIFKQHIDQTQPELLIGGEKEVFLPHPTPDGSDILYMVGPWVIGPNDKVRLMRVSLAGGGPSQQVLEKPGIQNYQCARLPSTICVYGRIDSEYYRFFVFDPSSGDDREIPIARLRKEVGMNSWNLSPDGEYLVTSKSQNPYDKPVLRLISLSDNKERYLPVTTGVKLIMGTDFAADSKSIWVGGYMGRGSWGTRSGIVNMDLNGHVRTLIEGFSPEILGGTPSPDGRHLALGANTSSSNIWLLENF